MDLGIKGRKAFVCASSQGLGLACATSLAREGCEVWINGRTASKLEEAAKQIEAQTGNRPHILVADITTEAGRAAIVAACPEADILVNNNAGPEPGKIADWSDDDWRDAVEGNMLAPIMLIKAYVPGMRARKFGRIINITSAMVKTPHYIMGLSTSARTALTAISKAISAEVVVDNVTVNNLLPERIETPRQEFMAQRMMAQDGITHEEARRRIASSINAKRMGKPEEFGAACAFLCSSLASYISGQNLQLDGGSYEGLV